MLDPNAGHLTTWNPTTEKKAAQLQNLAKDLAKRNQAVIEMEEVRVVRKSWVDDELLVNLSWESIASSAPSLTFLMQLLEHQTFLWGDCGESTTTRKAANHLDFGKWIASRTKVFRTTFFVQMIFFVQMTPVYLEFCQLSVLPLFSRPRTLRKAQKLLEPQQEARGWSHQFIGTRCECLFLAGSRVQCSIIL